MSNCPGLHCPACGDVSPWTILKLAAAVVALVLAVVFGVAIVITLAVAVVAVLALAAFFAVRAWRRGWRPSLDPVVAWEPLPAPEPARALPVPELHVHYHAPPQRTRAEIRGEFLAAWNQFMDPGSLTEEEAAEVAAFRQAAYRAFPDH